MFKTLNGLAPEYLSDMLLMYAPSRSLRSSGTGLLVVPRVRTETYGDRRHLVSTVLASGPACQRSWGHHNLWTCLKKTLRHTYLNSIHPLYCCILIVLLYSHCIVIFSLHCCIFIVLLYFHCIVVFSLHCCIFIISLLISTLYCKFCTKGAIEIKFDLISKGFFSCWYFLKYTFFS